MEERIITIPTRIGPPSPTRPPEQIVAPAGEGLIIDLCARGHDGKPLPDPGQYDIYLALSRTPGGEPELEWHMGDPQVSLVDPDKSKARFRLAASDLLLDEGRTYRFDGWSQRLWPEVEDPIRQVTGTIQMVDSILGRRRGLVPLSAVGFDDVISTISAQFEIVALRRGFEGGRLPISYDTSAGGIVGGSLILSREAEVDQAVTITATDGKGDTAIAQFRQVVHALLSFRGLADVDALRADDGEIEIDLRAGWAGGYGALTFEAGAGRLDGARLILPTDEVRSERIIVTATDSAGASVAGSFGFAVRPRGIGEMEIGTTFRVAA